MPDTGERREITSRVNAKEAANVRESKNLVSRTEPLPASAEAKSKARHGETKKSRAGARLAKTE